LAFPGVEQSEEAGGFVRLSDGDFSTEALPLLQVECHTTGAHPPRLRTAKTNNMQMLAFIADPILLEMFFSWVAN
jgi:hypothetical protein